MPMARLVLILTRVFLQAVVFTLGTGLAAADTSALIAAVRAGDHAAVRTALQRRAGVNAHEADGTTALLWAVLADDLESARLLVAAGADVNAANRFGVTPLQLAATNGSARAVGMLLAAGADPDVALPEGETALMTAARTGSVEALTALLDYGADASARESSVGETALMWAAAEDHAAAVRVLVTYGADANARSSTVAARRGGSRGGWTPLMYAARQDALDTARALVDTGVDIDAADPDGTTSLAIAVLNAHWDMAAALLERGADPNLADRTGMTPLYAAIDMGSLPAPFGRPDPKPTGPPDDERLIWTLLEYGADPNARLTSVIIQRLHTLPDEVLGAGATPFMRAAKSGNVAAMNALLEFGADPLLVQRNHTDALMIAAGLGWRDGFPIHPPYAAIRDHGTDREAIEAIQICLAAGADINRANDDGDTALHGAAEARGSTAIVRFLVQSGAKMDTRNKLGQTPLDAAFAHRDRAGTLLRTAAVAELRGLSGGGAADAHPH
jgi:ankyrin repeat protein